MRHRWSWFMLMVAASCASDDQTSERDRRRASLDQLLTLLSTPAGKISPGLQATHDAARNSVSVAGDAEGAQAFVAGVWRMLDAARLGHSGLFRDLPGNGFECTGAPFAQSAPYVTPAAIQAPARPTSTGFLVTTLGSDATNPLGLHLGDTVVRIGAARGVEAMTDLVRATPAACGQVYPSDSGRQASAAAAWGASVVAGMEVEVVAPDGASRVAVVPALSSPPPGAASQGTSDPVVSVRADGVTVLRVPSFLVAEQAIVDGCAKVAGARALVIDVRGNPGGWGNLAANLAAALPGGTSRNVIRSVYPDGRTNEQGPFESPTISLPNVPTAIVVDGLVYSSASLFVRFARVANVKIVGLPDAAAYSNFSLDVTLPGPPELHVTVDQQSTYDLASGAYLEGVPTDVDLRVERKAIDVVNGVDTELEAAAALVKPAT